ncbi:MAG: hypothetical protein ACM3Y9_03380 [Ignavibacteria bacterium]
MRKPCSLMLVALLLAGCVNVHVHFPAAPAAPADTPQAPAEPQKKP